LAATANLNSVFERRQSLQHIGGSWAVPDHIVFPDLSVAEDQHALRELRDVVLVRHQDDRQSLLVQPLKGFHDLDRPAAVEVSALPIATTQITAAMVIPRTVSTLRILLRSSATSAARMSPV